jgi:DNA polymerase III alpha subunit
LDDCFECGFDAGSRVWYITKAVKYQIFFIANVRFLFGGQMFPHLHMHSYYSFLSGASSPEHLCQVAKRNGITQLALTDTNGMHGALSFFLAAKDLALRPIFGVELTTSFPPKPREVTAIVLAKDEEGFSECCCLTSRRHLEPNFNLQQVLARTTQHVVVLTEDLKFACGLTKARKHRGGVFLEVVDHSRRGQPGTLSLAVAEAGKAGIPTVAGNRVYFAERNDHPVHAAMTAIRQHTTLEALSEADIEAPEAYLKNWEEMRQRFHHLPAAYCLGITPVDPIRHGLFFERFLNPERKDPPDIDLDFPWDQRDEMLKYAYQRFGNDQVAMIGTFVRLHARSAVREAAKVLGVPESEISIFCRKLPTFGRVADIFTAKEQIPENFSLPLLEEPWKAVLELAKKLENAPRHMSVHPGGICISPVPVEQILPLQMSSKGVVITQYDMYSVED